MKLLEIRHYIDGNHVGWPAYVLLMSDGKEYISCGAYFAENTRRNRLYLADVLGYEALANLLSAPSVAIEDLEDGTSMFEGFEDELEFDHPLTSLKYANRMFFKVKLIRFNSHLPNLIRALGAFYRTQIKTFSIDMPSLEYAESMFELSKIETFNSYLPKVRFTGFMFSLTPIKTFDVDMPNLENSMDMFCLSDLEDFNAKIPEGADTEDMFYNTPYEEKLNEIS